MTEQSLAYTMRMEIERLTAENERLRHDVASAGSLRLRMEAHREEAGSRQREIERLRAALDRSQETTLDAASEYLKEYYGIAALSHPIDRIRIRELIAAEALKDSTHD